MSDESNGALSNIIGVCFALLLIMLVLGLPMWLLPKYGVYRARMAGAGVLAEAESSRQVRIEEARSKKEAATMEAAAEIERAKGVAEANRIIGGSLEGNDSYLRYLWIQTLESGSAPTVVYIPTEAGLPIMEAGKRPELTKQPAIE